LNGFIGKEMEMRPTPEELTGALYDALSVAEIEVTIGLARRR
jgi:hypothetical protein